MKKTMISVGAISTILMMTSCGGGGGGSDTPISDTTPTATTSYVGYLIDSPVEGAGYNCGGKTGLTESDGKFECPSLPVSFNIGGVKLGEVATLPSDNKVFPQDIVGVSRDSSEDDKVVNIAMILQSLDSDGDASNGITISKEQFDKLIESVDVQSLPSEDIKAKIVAQDTKVKFKATQDVKAHLNESLKLFTDNNDVVKPTDDTVKNDTTPVDNTTSNTDVNTGDDKNTNNSTVTKYGSIYQYSTATPTIPTRGLTTIKKTGQSQSYDVNGVENKDKEIKDDGYYQKGTTPNYTRYSNHKVVVDNVTSLMWQDDEEAKTVTKVWTSPSKYDMGDYNNTSGDTAVTYCENLDLAGHSDWRLPTLYELKTLMSKYENEIESIFENNVNGHYWSSTKSDFISRYDKSTASTLDLTGGTYYSQVGERLQPRSDYNNVRCVRGESIKPNFVRNDDRKVVIDKTNKLMWQDNGGAVVSNSWTSAINYCESLEFSGFDDWRLPNINELYSISDPSKYYHDYTNVAINNRLPSKLKIKADYQN